MSAPTIETPRGTTIRYKDGTHTRTGELVHVFNSLGTTKILANVWVSDSKSHYWKQPVLNADDCEVV